MRDVSQFDGYDFIEARAHAIPWYDEHVSVRLVRRTHNGNYAGVVTFDTLVPAGKPIEPAFRLAHEEAQELMDSLWAAGLRPTQAKSSAGQTEAIQRHLEDMRTIAFNNLEITKP
jgi:hypothetical protein